MIHPLLLLSSKKGLKKVQWLCMSVGRRIGAQFLEEQVGEKTALCSLATGVVPQFDSELLSTDN